MSNSDYIFKGHSSCWKEISWSKVRTEAVHSIIAAGKREWIWLGPGWWQQK